MCGCLVGDEIEVLSAPSKLGNDVGGVAEQPDRKRATVARCVPHARERILQRLSRLVEIPRLEPTLDARRVDLDAQDRRACERRRQWLRAAHAAETGGQDCAPRERRRAEMLLPGGRERLVRALQDPLGADVDPRARGHLAEHGQPLRLESPELVPGRPFRDEQRVRDKDARRRRRCAEDRDWLPGLHEQCLIVPELE